MRAYRPSLFAREQDHQDGEEQIREANVQMYAKRAQVGLPLFNVPQTDHRDSRQDVGRYMSEI